MTLDQLSRRGRALVKWSFPCKSGEELVDHLTHRGSVHNSLCGMSISIVSLFAFFFWILDRF